MPASMSQARKFCNNYSVISFVCICVGLLRRPQRKKSSGPGLTIRVHMRPHPRTLFKNRTITTNSFEMFIWRTTYIFANICELRLNKFSYNYTPCTFDACHTYVVSLVAICRLWRALCLFACISASLRVIFLKSIPRTFPYALGVV